MKEVLEPLQARGCLFRRFESFSLKLVGSRKRVGVYHGVDTKSRYTLVFFVERKSRVLIGDAREWTDLKRRIESYLGHAIHRNFVVLKAPICSKAVAFLRTEGWRLIA